MLRWRLTGLPGRPVLVCATTERFAVPEQVAWGLKLFVQGVDFALVSGAPSGPLLTSDAQALAGGSHLCMLSFSDGTSPLSPVTDWMLVVCEDFVPG